MSDERPLIDDEFVGEPAKRALQYIQSKRSMVSRLWVSTVDTRPWRSSRPWAQPLQSSAPFRIKRSEALKLILPANLCPRIKSSYGFIITDTCPFYGLSDVVVAETTCDGKKKMYELIRDLKPIHVMDLPHVPDEKEAEQNWTVMIRKLQSFLETHLERKATDEI